MMPKLAECLGLGKVVVMSDFRHNRSNFSNYFTVVITTIPFKRAHFLANNETLWAKHTNTQDLMS